MRLPFVKMQGVGNDYVYVDGFRHPVERPEELARRVSDRHFGIGSDGLILVAPPEGSRAHARMIMYNADGSRAEMCGNGIRCVARYVAESGISDADPLEIETDAGVLAVALVREAARITGARVSMGTPALSRPAIPMRGDGTAVALPVEVAGRTVLVTAVSMGNPHCVVYVDDVDRYPVHEVGAALEVHELFPRRTNVEFVEVLLRSRVRQRTWERGSGETLGCGTGACAVCVAGVVNDRTDRILTVELAGGPLRIEWTPGGDVQMEGPAVEVFRGEIEV